MITDKNAFDYAMEDSDFISQMEFAGLTRGMSAVDEGHWAAARRLQQSLSLPGSALPEKRVAPGQAFQRGADLGIQQRLDDFQAAWPLVNPIT